MAAMKWATSLAVLLALAACTEQSAGPTAGAVERASPLFSITQGSTSTARTGSGSTHKATSITVQAPAAGAGSMLIAHIAVKSLAATDVICAPAGWVSIVRHNRSSNVSQQIFRLSVNSAQGATNYTWTFRKSAGDCGTSSNTVELAGLGAASVYEGVQSSGDPVDILAGGDGSGGTATAPGVTTTTSGALVLRFFAIDKGSDITTAERVYNHKETTEERALAGAAKIQSNAGATGTATATFTSANWVASTLTLKAAAPAVQSQTVTFAPLPARMYGDAAFNLTATASSGLAVSYTLAAGSAGCSLGGTSNATVTITGATGVGEACRIVASQAGSASYSAADPVEQSFGIGKAATEVGSVSATASTYGGATTLSATVSPSGVSGSVAFYINGSTTPLAASYTESTGVAVLTDHAHGLGAQGTSYSVRAVFTSTSPNHIGADATGTSALTVSTSAQTISFASLPDGTYGDPSSALSASSSSGLNVTFSSLTPGVCTVTGSTVNIVGAGACIIRASQSGSGNFAAAEDVDRTFTVAKAAATIVLSNLTHTYDGTAKAATAVISPAGLSGLAITYDGSGSAPTNPGGHAVVASLTHANYQATNATGTLKILNPAPAISAIGAPATAAIRATVTPGTFTLTLTGSGFSPDSRVRWTMGTSTQTLSATPVISNGSISFTLPHGLIAAPGVAYVQVANPAIDATDGGISALLPLFVTDETTGTTSTGIGTIVNGAGTVTAGTLSITGTGTGTVSAANFQGQPGGSTGSFATGASFLDVNMLEPGNALTSLTIVFCSVPAGAQVFWWSGSAWVPASHQQPNTPAAACITVTVNGSSTPGLNHLTGDYFAVGSLATTTTLSLGSSTVQYGAPLTLGASVTGLATVASSGTVKFIATPASGSPVTVAEQAVSLSGNPAGAQVASFQQPVQLLAGSYTLTAHFEPATGSPYAGSTSTGQVLTVSKTALTIAYTGDQYATTAGPNITHASVRLAAQLAKESDGSTTGITNAVVRFTVFRFNGNVHGTYTAPVSPAGAAMLTVNLPADDPYTVRAEVDPASVHFSSDYVSEGLTVVTGSADQRVTGGGWIPDARSRNGRGNFGFAVQFQRNGSPKGNAVYVFRDGEFDYIVKTTSWQSGGMSFRVDNDASKASFTARANFQKVRRADGSVVESGGNYTMTVDMFDGDLKTPRQRDAFAITVLDSAGRIWGQVGTRQNPLGLGGGNVAVQNGTGK